MDSSFQAIQNMAEDTSKVNACITYLGQFYSKDFDVAYDLAQDALEISLNLNYVEGMKESYGWLGFMENYFGNDEKALEYYEKYYEISEELNDFSTIKTALNNMAHIYSLKGEDKKAIELFEKCITLQKEHPELNNIGAAYLNLGQIYNRQGDFEKTFDYGFKGLRSYEKENDTAQLIEAQNMVGLFYRNFKDYKEARKYFEKAMENSERINNDMLKSLSLNGLGLVFKYEGELEKAINCFSESLEIRKRINDLRGQAESNFNLAKIYKDIGDLDKSSYYFAKSSKIDEQTGDMLGLIQSEMGRASIEDKQGNTENAINYYLKALKMAEKVGYVEQLKSIHSNLIRLYKNKKSYKKALSSYVAYDTLKFSLLDQEKNKAVAKKEAKYEYDKKAFEDSLKNAQKELKLKQEKQIKQEKIEKQSVYIVGGGVGLFLLIGLALVLIKSNRIKQKSNELINSQKREVEFQKQIVDRKNQEITDSIQYAKRLQEALLPLESTINDYFDKSFVYFLPKDIVSGDFYWFEHVPNEKVRDEKLIFFAAADCTGHGVPGAMVSVVCMNALNKAVHELHLTNPGEVLNTVRDLVIETFSKTGKGVSDGMDISLAVYDTHKKVVRWAGANNPLWIIRKNSEKSEAYSGEISAKTKITKDDNSESVLLDLKPDKQPIGVYDKKTPFSSHEIKIKKGDQIYLFSDGYIDQFGGEKGKKLKALPFKKLILKNSNKPMNEQKDELDKFFKKWKENEEQVDDVCVIGVRL